MRLISDKNNTISKSHKTASTRSTQPAILGHYMTVACVLLLPFLSSTTALATATFSSARAMGLSESGRAGAILTDTIYFNPALLGFQPAAAFSGTYKWINSAKYPAHVDRKSFNVGVVDGTNEFVGAGLAFTRLPESDIIQGGLSKKLGDVVAVGLSVKRVAARDGNVAQPTGTEASVIDGGASLAFALPESATFGVPIQIGLTSDNLLSKPSREPLAGVRNAAIGVKANFNKILMVYADYVRHFPKSNNIIDKPYTVSFGSEVALGSEIYLRAGLMRGDQSGYSAGLGWIGPKFGLSYGMQNKTMRSGGSAKSTDHAATLDAYL